MILVGSGYSLTGFDFERLRGLGRVVTVGGSMYDVPFAEAHCCIDMARMLREVVELTEYARRMEVWLGMADQRDFMWDMAPHIPGAIYIKRLRRGNTFSDDPAAVECGCNSGYAALNLVYLKRARLVVLFGYDYSSKPHYCEKRYAHQAPDHNAPYWANWARIYDGVVEQARARGLEIFNASPDSRITAFPRCTPDEGVELLAHVGKKSGVKSE